MDVEEIYKKIEYELQNKASLLKKDLLGKEITEFGDNIIVPENINDIKNIRD